MPKLGETCNTYGPLKDRCLYSQSTSTTVNLLIISMMSMLSIASWNVHGLTKDLKKEQLVMDAKRYGFDFVALQETKCQDYVHCKQTTFKTLNMNALELEIFVFKYLCMEFCPSSSCFSST